MQQWTTEILTMDEYSDRRKLGRTSIFARIKSGDYKEGIDFIIDGSEKKFFWPPKDFIKRDMLLQQMFSDVDVKGVDATNNTQARQAMQPAIAEKSLYSEMSDEQVKQKPSRREMKRQPTEVNGPWRPAFDL